jgi:hypothetical protein
VEPTLEARDRKTAEHPEEQASGVARRGRGRPAGQLDERDVGAKVKLRRQTSQAGAEHDAETGPKVRVAAHDGFENVEALAERRR